jgi:TorA maturation chaperone TorD
MHGRATGAAHGRTTTLPATAERHVTVGEEDVLRAQTYGLLGRLLRAPADAATIEALPQLAGDDTELGAAFRALALAAARATPEAVAEEYGALFIGLTHGELIPYGSYYLTGFLHERPLARLRGDMARLGIARVEAVKEPEDHVAALCEMMAGLIGGAFGEAMPVAEQERFFAAHLGGWAARFFEDLERAASADFYRPVGRIGRLFMDIERQAFAMAA